MFTGVIKALNKLIERLTSKQLLACTGAIGLLIASMVYLTLTHIESTIEDTAEIEKSLRLEMTKAVVAKVDIPRGAIISADMLTVKNFAVESLPEGTSSDIEEFVNLPTKLEIFAGDIMTTEKIFTDYRQAGFIGMIPENCRAVAVSVDNVTGIAGLMKAGDRVDVILVSKSENGTHSKVILQNVLLLSIKRNVDRYVQPPKDKKDESTLPNSLSEEKAEDESITKEVAKEVTQQVLPASGEVGTVTLALKPDEVTRIIAATTLGKIYLVLRPLKPRSDSMYINETDYYTESERSEPSQRGMFSQPTLPKIPSASPPSSFPNPVLPEIPNNGAKNLTPKNEAFEVIQWGN